jgi:hypothetical protein
MYADGSAVTLANLMFLVGPVLGDPAALDAMLSTFVDALRPSRPTTLDDLFAAFEPAACAARCPPTASSRSRAPAAGIPETQLGVRLLFSADLADRSMRRPAATPGAGRQRPGGWRRHRDRLVSHRGTIPGKGRPLRKGGSLS